MQQDRRARIWREKQGRLSVLRSLLVTALLPASAPPRQQQQTRQALQQQQ
jgi:hypothetical protein